MATKWAFEHDWREQGWTPFDRVDVGLEPGATYAQAVQDDRGRLTGGGDANNTRTWWLHRSALAVDSEVRSLWWGGSAWDTAANQTPQMGHVHRAQRDEYGVWRAYVVTNNVFASDQNTLNINIWRGDGNRGVAGFGFAQAGFGVVSKAMPLSRVLPVHGVSRVNFGGWVNSHRVPPGRLEGGIAAGDRVQISSLDSTFTTPVSGVAVSSVDSAAGTVAVVSPIFTGAVASKYDDGALTPLGPDKYWPYWVASRLIGDVLTLKAWRYGDPEPEWGAATNVSIFDLAAKGVSDVGTPDARKWGYSGIVSSHLRNNYVEYGDLSFKQL